MSQPPCRKDVEEQLAGALLVLSEATLGQVLRGLQAVLGSFSNRTHRRSLNWLWALEHGQFGQIVLGQEGLGLRPRPPEDGADLLRHRSNHGKDGRPDRLGQAGPGLDNLRQVGVVGPRQRLTQACC